MKTVGIKLVFLAVIAMTIQSCFRSVSRVDPSEEIDISGKFEINCRSNGRTGVV